MDRECIIYLVCEIMDYIKKRGIKSYKVILKYSLAYRHDWYSVLQLRNVKPIVWNYIECLNSSSL